MPGHLFSTTGLKALSTHVGKFVKLHPHTEKCTRLDTARILIEVNLHKPLVEAIQFKDQEGAKIKVGVLYPWLPSRCSICSKWGHNTKECKSPDVRILLKETSLMRVDEEVNVVVPAKTADLEVVEKGDLETVVGSLITELEAATPFELPTKKCPLSKVVGESPLLEGHEVILSKPVDSV